MTDLKPCPFCGGTELNTSYKNEIWCRNCDAGVHLGDHGSNTSKFVIEAWNTRVDDKIIEAAHEVASCLLLENMQRPGLTFSKIKELAKVLYEEK